MSTNHNRIKVSDLESNQPNRTLITNENGELEFSDINNIKIDNYNALDYTLEGKVLDARQGKVLKDLIENINTVLTSDNLNLNTIQKLVDTIETIQVSLDNILIDGLSIEKPSIVDEDRIVIDDSENSFFKKSVKWLSIKTILNNLFLGTSTDQNVLGIKTFMAGKFGLRNVANTFTSFFSNANTASRTYTFQNRNGTIMDDTDLTTRMPNPTSAIPNYLPKFLTITTIGLSRLWDTGFFFGLGTLRSPSKDFTFGNQGNREIGIEESDANTAGRDLVISAGRTNDYLLNNVFVNLNTLNQYTAITISQSGDIYLLKSGSVIVKQTAATGPFVSIGATFSPTLVNEIQTIAIAPNGQFYALREGTGTSVYVASAGSSIFGGLQGINYTRPICVGPNNDAYLAAWSNGGDIFKRTGGTGTFIGLGQGIKMWKALCVSPNGDIYAAVYNGDIYVQYGGVGAFVSSGQTIRAWNGIAAAPNGNIYACVSGGDIYVQYGGMGAFNALGQTARSWNGIAVHPNGNIYAIVAGGDLYLMDQSAKGLPNLDGGSTKIKAGTGKGNAKSRIEFWTGQKLPSGTDMQSENLRCYIDENGIMVWVNMPTYADNATALSGGLSIGSEYKTATGDRKIVY